MTTQAIRKALDTDDIISLSNGDRVRVPKWSVRKAITMSSTIAKIVERFFRQLEKKGSGDNVSIADFVAAIPAMLTDNMSDLTYVVVESLTLKTGEKQISEDKLLDDLVLDDFVEIIGAILDRNFGEDAMGKWKRVLKKIPILNQDPTTD